MASVYRRSYWSVDPKTGTKVRKLHRKYTAKFKVAPGKWETKPAFRDKSASLTLANKLEKRAARERMGISDPFEDHEASELSAHVDAFEIYLRGKGDCDDHVARTAARVRAVVDGCKFEKIAQVNGSKVVEYLHDCRNKNTFSKQTSNYYLTAIKSFTKWLVRDRRAAADPLAHLQRLNVEGEQSRTRRAVPDDDFAKIIEAARTGAATHLVSGPDRAMLYMVAAYTGFRAHELSTLMPESFSLVDPPSVTVLAGYSKRRQQDTQPLRSDLAALLGEWLAGRAPGKPLWPGNWYRRAAEMMRVDLKAAGVAYVEDGAHLDFHALRHTYITSLHRGGVYGKLLQSLARHSVGTLTERYTHIALHDRDAAVDKLPPLPTAKPKKKKTG